MKRIVVPDEMLMAARKRWPESATGEAVIRDRIEAALQWLVENPIMPTIIQIREVESAAVHEPRNSTQWMSDVLTEWQRRIFLAPEPKPEVSFDEIWNSLTVEINRLGMGAALEVLKRTS